MKTKQQSQEKLKPKFEKLSDREHEALAGGRWAIAASASTGNRAPI